MRLNAISLPLNPAYSAPELRYFLDDSQAKVFFADAANRDKVERGRQAERLARLTPENEGPDCEKDQGLKQCQHELVDQVAFRGNA